MNGWHTFYKTCIILATLVAGYLLYELNEIVIVLFVAIIFASAIRPLVHFLADRKIPQGVAIILIYLISFSSLVGLMILALPPLAKFTIDLISSEGLLMKQMQQVVVRASVYLWREFNVIAPVLGLPKQIQDFLAQADDTARSQAWPLALNTFIGLGQFILALAVTFYWLTARQDIIDLLLRTSPPYHRHKIELIWTDIENTLGAYVRGQIILVLVIGAASFAGLYVLRVPYALALAIVAGLTEIIPFVGPILGAALAILVSFTISPLTSLLVAGWYLLVQQVEANILVPKVMHDNVGLSPLVVILALVAGATLNGVIGALLAIPVVGGLQVVAKHLLIEPALEKSTSQEMRGVLLPHGGTDPSPEQAVAAND